MTASLVLQIDVSDKSSEEIAVLLAQVRRWGKATAEGAPVEGWTHEAKRLFTRRLLVASPQLHAVWHHCLADDEGSIPRDKVFELIGRSPDRKLSSFRKPVLGVMRSMIADGNLPPDATVPLETVYDTGGTAIAFRIPPTLAEFFGS